MKIKNAVLLGLLSVCIIFTGCSTIKNLFHGKATDKVEKQTAKIEKIEDKVEQVNRNKVAEVSELSYGVGYSLNKSTNNEPAISVAKELNLRVESLAGLPSFKQQKAMIDLVENLISNNIQGKIELKNKDAQLTAIQVEESLLMKQRDIEIDKALTLSKKVAMEDDKNKSQLDKYTSWFGLGAIFMGFKQLFITGIWFIVIFGVIFLILRLAAASNPICGILFSIFNTIGAMIIHGVQLLAPKALTMVQSAEGTALKKVTDAIQWSKSTGINDVNSITEQLSKVMTPQETAVIDKIKADLNYK